MEDSVESNVLRAYYSILIAEKRKHYLDESIKRLEKLKQDQEKLYKNGFWLGLADNFLLFADGFWLGLLDGFFLGLAEGFLLGPADGFLLGFWEGFMLGFLLGF